MPYPVPLKEMKQIREERRMEEEWKEQKRLCKSSGKAVEYATNLKTALPDKHGNNFSVITFV